jgi:division protein CdvB (Snf7/Vps24/ESCRT-III family)
MFAGLGRRSSARAIRTGIAIGMTDLAAAQTRLEAAIARLEAAVETRARATSAGQAKLNEALTAARGEYAQLAATTGQVSERLDAVIRRLNALLEG